MPTEEFFTALFVKADEAMADLANYVQAALCPSEFITVALLYVIKGSDPRSLRKVRRSMATTCDICESRQPVAYCGRLH